MDGFSIGSVVLQPGELLGQLQVISIFSLAAPLLSSEWRSWRTAEESFLSSLTGIKSLDQPEQRLVHSQQRPSVVTALLAVGQDAVDEILFHRLTCEGRERPRMERRCDAVKA